MNSPCYRVPYSLFFYSATQWGLIHAKMVNYARLQNSHGTSAHKLPISPTAPPATASMKVQAIKLIVRMKKKPNPKTTIPNTKDGPQSLQTRKSDMAPKNMKPSQGHLTSLEEIYCKYLYYYYWYLLRPPLGKASPNEAIQITLFLLSVLRLLQCFPLKEKLFGSGHHHQTLWDKPMLAQFFSTAKINLTSRTSRT